MNLQEIKKLMEIFSGSEIAKLSLKNSDIELKLEKQSMNTQSLQPPTPLATPSNTSPSAIPSPTPTPQQIPDSGTHTQSGDFITSPMVGTFYRCPSPGAAPYINVGDTIKKGQTIGIIEAMKIMNEIESECDCKILSIEVDDATPVEFGTNLVRIQKL